MAAGQAVSLPVQCARMDAAFSLANVPARGSVWWKGVCIKENHFNWGAICIILRLMRVWIYGCLKNRKNCFEGNTEGTVLTIMQTNWNHEPCHKISVVQTSFHLVSYLQSYISCPVDVKHTFQRNSWNVCLQCIF